MNKILVVKAHPLNTEQSSTLKLLESFVTEYHKIHPQDQITTVDVFKKDFPAINEQVLLSMQLPEENLSTEQKKLLQEIHQYTNQFLDADKIIIANPLWNFMIPSQLKQWLDTIIQVDKTFAYTSEGKLCYAKDKKILHLQSNGSPTNGQDLASKYLDIVFDFIGIPNVKHIYIDGKDVSSLSEKAILDAHQEALTYAKEF